MLITPEQPAAARQRIYPSNGRTCRGDEMRRSLFGVGLESLALEEGLLGGAKVATETGKREVIFLVTITWVESTFPPRGTYTHTHKPRRGKTEEKLGVRSVRRRRREEKMWAEEGNVFFFGKSCQQGTITVTVWSHGSGEKKGIKSTILAPVLVRKCD